MDALHVSQAAARTGWSAATPSSNRWRRSPSRGRPARSRRGGSRGGVTRPRATASPCRPWSVARNSWRSCGVRTPPPWRTVPATCSPCSVRRAWGSRAWPTSSSPRSTVPLSFVDAVSRTGRESPTGPSSRCSSSCSARSRSSASPASGCSRCCSRSSPRTSTWRATPRASRASPAGRSTRACRCSR